jgi:hypothetical protein
MIYANSTRQSSRLAGKFEGSRSIWESMTSSGPHGSRHRYGDANCDSYGYGDCDCYSDACGHACGHAYGYPYG